MFKLHSSEYLLYPYQQLYKHLIYFIKRKKMITLQSWHLFSTVW